MHLKSLLPLALTLLLPAAAHADQDYTFTFSGAQTDSFSFTYAEPDAIPYPYEGAGPYLVFFDANITFDGATSTALAIAPQDDGIAIVFLNGIDQTDYAFTGPGIFTLNQAGDAATLNLGDTTLYENGNPGILNISVPTQTPEPAPLALLTTGLLTLGATLRRRLHA